MVDLHCHILYGLDDGARTIEDSLAMAEDAIADGITHVVGTPHASSEYKFDFAKVRVVRDELSEKLGDRLKLATGCDFHLNPENVQAVRKELRTVLRQPKRLSAGGIQRVFDSSVDEPDVA